MNINFNQMPFNSARILSELTKEEIIYLVTIISIFKKSGKNTFPMELSYKYLEEKLILDNQVKELLKNSTFSEVRENIIDLLQCQEYFCIEDLKKSINLHIQEYLHVVKIGICSIIEEKYVGSLVGNYINCDKYENILEKIEMYLKESIDYPSISLFSLLYYLDDHKEDISEYKEKISLMILKYYTEHMIKVAKQKPRGYPKEEFENLYEKYGKIEEDYLTIKLECKELKEENKKLRNIKDQVKDTLKEINDNIDKKEVNYEQALKEVKEFKYDVLENTYKTMTLNLTNQISELKILNKELKDKNKELNEEINELTFELKGNELSVENNEYNINEVSIEDVEPEVVNNIGYCQIMDNVHYVTFLNGKSQELLNMPEKLYLTENQFILVDKEGNFIYAYSYYKNTNIIGGITLGIIRVKYGNFIVEVNGKDTDIVLPTGFNFKDGQVLGFDCHGNMKILFKQVRGILDFFVNSIKAKSHVLYFVLKRLSNGLMIRDIFTNQEKFIQDIEEETINVGEILCLNDEENLINIIRSSKYYTKSSLYQSKSYAMVIAVDGEIYCKNQNTGEVLKVNSSEREIHNGDLVEIDEFVNVLSFVDSEMERNHISEQRIKRNNVIYKKNKSSEITISHRLLILGNISYENNYKKSFYKRGYQVEVVDGYLPYYKISSSLKNVDYVIVIGGHTSHDNMWKIKEENISAIFPKTNGANSVLDEFEIAIDKLDDNG